MIASISLRSEKFGEINKFLSKYYNTDLRISNDLIWKKKYPNPIEMTDLIGTFVDNIDCFNIKMWVHLDKDIYIKISEDNANDIIKYLYERYPY